MNQDLLHAAHPHFNRLSRASRLASAFAAVLTSTALLGGTLGLFNKQSSDAALARATSPATPASSALAVGDLRRRSRS
jgi:hypothetical protein